MANLDKTNIEIKPQIANLLKTKGFNSDDSLDFFPTSPEPFGILTQNWNKIFFYRLVIASVKDDGTYETVKLQSIPLVYNLPISPQNLSIVSPFATQTTVLSDGILVESNGSPLKQITIQGTTGIVPYRDTAQTSFDTSAFSAFAPNIGRVVNNVKAAAQSLNPALVLQEIKKKQAIYDSSGYTLFHKLSQFLNYYAFLSKKSENKNLRLVLDLVKDNTTFVCTPKSFSLMRAANEPLEYKYSIQLEAWKRIKLDSSAIKVPDLKRTLGQDINSFLAQIRRIMRVIAAASEIISAIRGDIDKLLDLIRTVAFFIKATIGAIVSLIDLPASIVRDIKGVVQDLLNTISDAKTTIVNAWNNAQNQDWGPAIKFNSDDSLVADVSLDSAVGSNSTAASLSSAAGAADTVDNSTPGAPEQAQSSSKGAAKGNLLAEAFNQPFKKLEFFDAVSVNDLNLPPNIKSKVDKETARVKSLTRKDFENYRNYINEVSNDVANAFGKGSSRLNTIKGYVATSSTDFNGNITRNQYELLISFRKLSAILDKLSNSSINTPTPLNESFNFVGRLADSAGIPFGQYPGKFAVPVPYGANIQDIARQYLSDANKATDIIILNRLLPPYIDEDGQYEDILSSSYKKTFNVENGSNLYLNQKIIFYANNLAPFSRKIINIQKITNTNWQIEVNGTTDLNLLITNSPRIQYFAKNTVSSRDLIYIPSNSPPIFPSDNLKPIPAYAPDSDPLISLAKIDIALDSDGDIIIDSTGEIRLAAGLTNLLQALRIKFLTPLNSLNRHPGFGFGVLPGTPISELNFSELKRNIAGTILSDKRFKEVLALNFDYSNATLKIDGAVSVDGVNGVLPFNFSLQS